ncbi:MAG: sigma 54-interacting transcriptional regulator, partial [Anaerolineales bacterium]
MKQLQITSRHIDENAAMRAILQGTATETGTQFFSSLVRSLADVLGTHGAWVTEYLEETHRLRALAFWLGGEFVPDYEHEITGTPCQKVVENSELVHYPDKVLELYPHVENIQRMGAVSYMGVPLLDVSGNVLGHLAVLDQAPLPVDENAAALFRIFADRASAELQRLRAENEVRESREKLGRLLDTAMDAIIELDHDLRVTRLNSAAEKIFGTSNSEAAGRDFSQMLSGDSAEKLKSLAEELGSRPSGGQYLWIPGGLRGRNSDSGEFPAEATLSRFEMHRDTFFTLILRDVNERLKAEETIRSLASQAEYLREEIREMHNFEDIVGRSESLLHVLREIRQVAETDTTVLLLGETGTGKELLARAIHASSRRNDRPLVKVNCAAIPPTLIESELFGHEKGAFTGATHKHDGRFALADGGTIFLDEIGELPVELQPKLLRVLQEGEFEPVGSSKTTRVDVRVLAATNRDLHRAVKDGEFREDLYYRLNVVPIEVPPLRKRVEDIALLAAAFTRKFAQRHGRHIHPLSDPCIRMLEAYDWPGNIRELQNVIERAVITSHDGYLNFVKMIPDRRNRTNSMREALPNHSDSVLTVSQMQDLERRNLVRAMEESNWRVGGS